MINKALKTLWTALVYAFCIVGMSALVGTGLMYGASKTSHFTALLEGKALVITVLDLSEEKQ
ncbi:TPA: hypothetical protein ACMDQ0_002063 [Vibrio cholerae]|uniref:hypothetical protein n=1 Tax=Vibrio cholerae TaxID=666 RepID=UPI000893682C|nr:hypothetical protein [Vibrio cholerae]EGQ9962451.1 hypothetical protein [Vibrio cholerae]ELT7568171.1 hypothetical protein [Vibrio cholerae]OFJ32702.1 hypothetical protein BFX34_08880 [Vibrio cholerae]